METTITSTKYHKKKANKSELKEHVMGNSKTDFQGFYLLPRLYAILGLEDFLNY